MASILKSNTLIPATGTTITIGESGDTVALGSGASQTGFGSANIDDNGTATTITIDSSNRVGIGTTSPTQALTVNGQMLSIATSGASFKNITPTTDNNYLWLGNTGNNMYVGKERSTGGSLFVGSSAYAGVVGNDGAYPLQFATNNNVRATIDSSGNVLVGKTSANFSTEGVELDGTNKKIQVTRNGGVPLLANRLTSDGGIIAICKDSNTIGTIACHGGGTEVSISASGTNASGVYFSNSNSVLPMKDSGVSDNTQDLGGASERWDDVYATNGTIQTSDQNEKQSIQSLTSSEIAVAKRISKLFKTFKWNSAVEEKGDSARTHTGVIAQDVQQAFADEGLDASNYALFISSTWWEKEISVDAVAEELDEEGNVIIEGQDAYTYIDKKEEATEGYTERTRLGIRYPELLSFVSSAFEQRLTNIETRLEVLENA